MVLQRRLDYGFNGYQVPVVPRASRSARGTGPIRKKCENNQKHAFEILASVAGELLQGGISAPSNTACGKDLCNVVKKTVQREQVDRGKFLKIEPLLGEPCNEKAVACIPELHHHLHGNALTKFLHNQESFNSKGSLASERFDYSETIYVAEKLVAVHSKNAGGSPSAEVNGDLPHAWKTFEGKVEGAIERKQEAELVYGSSFESGTLLVKESLEDAMDLDTCSIGLASSESNVKASLFKDCTGLCPFSRPCADIKVVSKDDDENSVGCSQYGTIPKTYMPLSFTENRRLSNLSASRHWRVAPNLKSGGYFRTDWKTKPLFHKGRTSYSCQTSQKIFAFKKRKFFGQGTFPTSDGAFHCEEIFNSSYKRTIDNNMGSATEASSSVTSQHASMDSRGCNVKLSIKSFKVPELFIEIPATATVGLLKRTVMEAVTAILVDGLHVGILLQGKKVRDDSKTLLQTGISEDDKHDNLGFILEPRHAKMVPPPCTKTPSNLSVSAPEGITRHTTSLMLQAQTSHASPVPPETNFSNSVGNDLGAVFSLAKTLTSDKMLDSRALVPVPAVGMGALSVVPLNCKSVHSEFGQRWIRRPFKVSEVEALVQAVEKLGTGRWHDVKLHAFEKANHRTFVDLKDKWKTLVHTARISPQQRRGEPVPQELLDRVLAAHAYWSQHQARQLVKTAVDALPSFLKNTNKT